MRHHRQHQAIRTVLLCGVLVFGARDAFAECEWINEYTSLFAWQVSASSGIVRYEADGTADGHGDECGTIYVEVELLDPSGNVMDFASGGSSATAWIEFDEPQEEGDWTAGLMTWEDNVYIGCGTSREGLANHATYYKNPSGSPPNCTYGALACCPGTNAVCTQGVAIIFALQACPPVVRVAYISIDGQCFKVGVGIQYPQTCGNCS